MCSAMVNNSIILLNKMYRDGRHLNQSSTFGNEIPDNFRTFLQSWIFGAKILIGALVLFVNLLVLIVLIVSKKSRPQGSVFICSLMVADLVFPVLSVPFQLYQLRRFGSEFTMSDITSCRATIFFQLFVIFAAILNMITVTLDRYIAVMWPFKYKEILSPVRIAILITLLWIITFFFALIGSITSVAKLPMHSCFTHQTLGHQYITFLCVTLILALTFLFIAYTTIVKEVRRNFKRTCPVNFGKFEQEVSHKVSNMNAMKNYSGDSRRKHTPPECKLQLNVYEDRQYPDYPNSNLHLPVLIVDQTSNVVKYIPGTTDEPNKDDKIAVIELPRLPETDLEHISPVNEFTKLSVKQINTRKKKCMAAFTRTHSLPIRNNAEGGVSSSVTIKQFDTGRVIDYASIFTNEGDSEKMVHPISNVHPDVKKNKLKCIESPSEALSQIRDLFSSTNEVKNDVSDLKETSLRIRNRDRMHQHNGAVHLGLNQKVVKASVNVNDDVEFFNAVSRAECRNEGDRFYNCNAFEIFSFDEFKYTDIVVNSPRKGRGFCDKFRCDKLNQDAETIRSSSSIERHNTEQIPTQNNIQELRREYKSRLKSLQRQKNYALSIEDLIAWDQQTLKSPHQYKEDSTRENVSSAVLDGKVRCYDEGPIDVKSRIGKPIILLPIRERRASSLSLAPNAQDKTCEHFQRKGVLMLSFDSASDMRHTFNEEKQIDVHQHVYIQATEIVPSGARRNSWTNMYFSKKTLLERNTDFEPFSSDELIKRNEAIFPMIYDKNSNTIWKNLHRFEMNASCAQTPNKDELKNVKEDNAAITKHCINLQRKRHDSDAHVTSSGPRKAVTKHKTLACKEEQNFTERKYLDTLGKRCIDRPHEENNNAEFESKEEDLKSYEMLNQKERQDTVASKIEMHYHELGNRNTNDDDCRDRVCNAGTRSNLTITNRGLVVEGGTKVRREICVQNPQFATQEAKANINHPGEGNYDCQIDRNRIHASSWGGTDSNHLPNTKKVASALSADLNSENDAQSFDKSHTNRERQKNVTKQNCSQNWKERVTKTDQPETRVAVVLAKKKRADYKAIQAMFSVLGLFFLCWLPLLIALLLELSNYRSVGTVYSQEYFIHISNVGSILNALLNPLLYVTRTGGFRRALKRMKAKLGC